MKKIINICAGLVLCVSSQAFGLQVHADYYRKMSVAPGQQRIFNVRQIVGKDVQLHHPHGAYHGVLNTVLWPQVTYHAHAGFLGKDYLWIDVLDAENRVTMLMITVKVAIAKP